MGIIGSTDLGDGRLALSLDVDPTSSFPDGEAHLGDLLEYDRRWWRVGSSSSAIPELNLHQHLHQLGEIDPVGQITPEAWKIPAAGPAGEFAALWMPVFVGSGATAERGAVPAPPTTPGTDLFLREDGTWQQPSTGYTEATVQTTDNTPTEIDSFTLEDGRTILVKASFVAHGQNVDEYAGYIREAVLYRDGAGVIRIGPTNTALSRETNGKYNAYIEVNGNDVQLLVQGDTGETVNWKVRYTKIEVA